MSGDSRNLQRAQESTEILLGGVGNPGRGLVVAWAWSSDYRVFGLGSRRHRFNSWNYLLEKRINLKPMSTAVKHTSVASSNPRARLFYLS